MSPLFSLSQQAFYSPVRIPSTSLSGAGTVQAGNPQTGNAQAAAPQAGSPQTSQQVAGRPRFDTYECQTCKNRKYKDGSNDPGVSFKTPTHLSPENAVSAIRSHEGEHVSHARAQAQREDQEIVSQSVTYHMDTCPECGRTYMSGGTTRTVFRSSQDPSSDGEMERKGAFIDVRV